MKFFERFVRVILPIATILLLSACGGGGGGSAGSKNAPYLISAPQISYATSAVDASKYDVTVTIEADGPSGIYSAGVWLIDINNSSNFAYLDLVNTGGTTWSATTYSLVPMASGTYFVESVELFDADPLVASSYKMGWYFEMPTASTSHYYVDQRDVYSAPLFDMIAFGVSGIRITGFTLP